MPAIDLAAAPRGPLASGSPARIGLAARRLPRSLLLDGLVVAAFSAFLVLQIARHAMWRDELNAWGIVLASPSLGDLFALMHYEGHPALWHLLLWLAAHVSRAPQTIQVVHATIGVGIIGMIGFASPFGRAERILLLLGYFVLFDYTVVSRNYGIGLLLALVYAQRRALHPDQLKRNAVLLGLLANTNVFALILAAGLALEYACSRLPARGRPLWPWLASLAAPAGMLLAMVAFSVATFWPAPDTSWRTTGRPLSHDLSTGEVLHVLTNNLSAMVPIDFQSFWYSVTAPPAWNYPLFRLIILGSLPLQAAAYLRIFAARPRLLMIPAVTLVGTMAFELIFYEGFVRHWGINFVAFLSALWILRATVREPTPWALPLLGLSAVAGVLFTLQHWAIPFSNVGATADWLRAQGLQDAALIGTADTHVAAVAEELGRPITFLDCRCSDTYLLYARRRDDFDTDQIPARLAQAVATRTASPAIFLDTTPVTAGQRDELARYGLDLRLRAAFTGALNENFQVYEVDSRGEAPRQDGPVTLPGAR